MWPRNIEWVTPTPCRTLSTEKTIAWRCKNMPMKLNKATVSCSDHLKTQKYPFFLFHAFDSTKVRLNCKFLILFTCYADTQECFLLAGVQHLLSVRTEYNLCSEIPGCCYEKETTPLESIKLSRCSPWKHTAGVSGCSSSSTPRTRHYMEMSSQFHAPAALARRNSTGCSLNRRICGPRSRSGCFGVREKSPSLSTSSYLIAIHNASW